MSTDTDTEVDLLPEVGDDDLNLAVLDADRGRAAGTTGHHDHAPLTPGAVLAARAAEARITAHDQEREARRLLALVVSHRRRALAARTEADELDAAAASLRRWSKDDHPGPCACGPLAACWRDDCRGMVSLTGKPESEPDPEPQAVVDAVPAAKAKPVARTDASGRVPRCTGCYRDDFRGWWWCENCEQWPCACTVTGQE